MRAQKLLFVTIPLVILSLYINFDSIRNALGLYNLAVPVLNITSDADLVRLHVPIELHKGSNLDDTLRLIHSRLEAGESLSFKQTSDFLLWNQEDAYIKKFFQENEAIEENRAFLENLIDISRKRFFSLVPMNLEALSPIQIKVELENALQDSFNGRPLMLSRDKSSVLDLLTLNQGQDYSTTMLYLMIARQMGKREFDKKNFSVIFTEGRIYPGYIEVDGESRRVFGLDFHRDGDGGPIYFGKLRDLSAKIEVIDAEYFLMTNLFRGRIAKACKLRNLVRSKSYKKWGKQLHARVEVDCKKTEEKYIVGKASKNSFVVADPISQSIRGQKRKPLREVGGSIFAFGAPRMLPGKTARLRGNVLRDLSIQYASLDVEPVAKLVDSLEKIQSSN